MNEFKRYQRKGEIEARPYEDGESLDGVSISTGNRQNLVGGMIARNPDDPQDMWFISKDYFEKHYATEA